MTNIKVTAVDPLTIEAQALVVAIGSSGQWNSRIDRSVLAAFMHRLRYQTHRRPLWNGQTVFVPATGRHAGNFESVLFVVDDALSSPAGEERA